MIYSRKFKGQGKWLLRGAKACASVAIAGFARFSQMSDKEFANTFLPSQVYTENFQKEKAHQILNNIVNKGAKINTSVSSGFSFFYNLLRNKDVEVEVWNKIKEQEKRELNIKSADKTSTIEYHPEAKNVTLLYSSSSSTEIVEQTFASTDNANAVFKEMFKKNWTQIHDSDNDHHLGLVVTIAGHTTVLFQREIDNQTYYISLNSGDKSPQNNSAIDRHFRQVGKMEIHQTLDSLCESVTRQWKGENKKEIQDQVNFTVFQSSSPKLKVDTRIHLDDETKKFFQHIQDFVSMPEIRNLTSTFTLPTGIKKIKKELFENNEDISKIIGSIKEICSERPKSDTRHHILKEFYETVASVNDKENSLSKINKKLRALKKELKDYSKNYDDVREFSKPRFR